MLDDMPWLSGLGTVCALGRDPGPRTMIIRSTYKYKAHKKQKVGKSTEKKSENIGTKIETESKKSPN